MIGAGTRPPKPLGSGGEGEGKRGGGGQGFPGLAQFPSSRLQFHCVIPNRSIYYFNSLLDKPLHYLWVNASCHPEYGDIFGISPDNLPALLFAKPKQRLFKTLHGDLTKEEVSEVISEIFLGREDLSPFSRFNEMLSVDCQETEISKKTDKDDAKHEDSKNKEKK